MRGRGLICGQVLFATVMFGVLLVNAAAHAQLPVPQKVALLAGVNQYEKRYFAERPLQFAERDVEHMAVELQKNGFTVKLLKGSLAGSDRATKENIDAALAETLKGRSSSDIILIGFAGHGQQLPLRNEKGEVLVDGNGKQMEDAYFCPVDSVLTEPDSMVSLTKLIQTLDVKGGVNLVLVDACRDNADPARGVRSISGNELNGRLPRNTALLFSCAAGQQALETPLAGGGHGVFFHHVLMGLQGEARNARGEVTWSRLVEYVGENTDPQAHVWFPERVERAVNGRLQTPHELRNLIGNPVLAKVAIAPVVIPQVNSPLQPPVNNPPSNNAAPLPEITNSLGMKLKLIPAGEFLMGARTTEAGHTDDEVPQHLVKISSPFYLGVHEVTRGEWKSLMQSEPWKREPLIKDGEQYAATYINWNEAKEFCHKLTDQERAAGRLTPKQKYQLPTEAQWEYACRSGTSSIYSFGRDAGKLGDYAWWGGGLSDNGNARTEPFAHIVGSKLPNPWGLHDMHGNVAEWCEDGYDEDAYANRRELTIDPLNNIELQIRVIRGGAWNEDAESARSAGRNRSSLTSRHTGIEFRIFRTP